MPAAQQPVTSTAAPAAARSGLPAVPNLVPAVAYSSKEKEPLSETLKRAGKRALGGGIPGAAAMGLQVLAALARLLASAACLTTPPLPSSPRICCCSAVQVLSLMWLRTTVNYQYR
jgi:hypothetical protein